MKKIAIIILLCFDLISVSGQDLSVKSQKVIRNFIETIKTKNKDKIANQVRFPLKREYPIPEIKNKDEFTKRFSEVFDNKLISEIANSKIKEDWSEMGWRGIMLLNREVWLNYEGELIGVNYQSKVEKKILEELINTEKNSLHESLRNFKMPVCILETSKYRIRIDDMGHEKYRYASWKLQQNKNDKPEFILQNGKFEADGNGGNCSYIFKSGNYVYECGIIEIGEEDAPPAYLTITKGGKEMVYQKAKIIK